MADTKNIVPEVDGLIDEDDEDTQKDKYLTFTVGGEDYGIEICYVTEIIGIQKITDVPDMPAYIKGVINLRGKVIPVLDVRIRFRMPEREYDDRTCIIVVNVTGNPIGLVVDTVKEVLSIPPPQVEPPPEISGTAQQYLKGLGKVSDEVKILLDVEKLVRRDGAPAPKLIADFAREQGIRA
ncbi:MAG: chemotaxis protein CheW [Desulfobacterota bacterium]|nr:chemotaxis protein CheW [Thermodesulfobacteriota bacterium]